MDGSETTPSTRESTGAKSMRAEDWVTYVVVVILLVAAGWRLELTVGQSAALFGRGIALIERAFDAHAIDTGLAGQQIFTLSLAHEVVTFKATALFIGAIISVLGALFVLRAGQVAYRASFETSGWKLGLGTSSPGLVMITLGCALIAVAILANASVESRVPASSSNGSGPPSDYAAQIQQIDAYLESTKPKPPTPETSHD